VSALSSDPAQIVTAVVSVLTVIFVFGFIVAVVVVHFDKHFVESRNFETEGGQQELSFENKSPTSMMIESLGVTFDAARSSTLIVRIYFLEELSVSILLQALSGIPPSSSTCIPVSVTMAVVALLHLLYLVLVRPYAKRVELILSIIAAALLVMMTILAICLTTVRSVPSLETAFAGIMVLQNAFFMIQATVLGVIALAGVHKRRLLRRWAEDSERMNQCDAQLLVVQVFSDQSGDPDDPTTGAGLINPLRGIQTQCENGGSTKNDADRTSQEEEVMFNPLRL
jgi:hypothetical protein